jgi:hypothetical protein
MPSCCPSRAVATVGLNLSGGRHLLSYSQALAYVRTRHGVQAEGDVGGDLPRTDTATRALTVDQGLDSAAKLLSLSLSRLPARNVTLPTVPDPAAPGRLLPEEPQDDVIFQMILDGQSWRQQLPSSRPARSASGSSTAPGRRGWPGRSPPGCAASASVGARRRPGPGGGPGPDPQRRGQHLLRPAGRRPRPRPAVAG